MKSLVVPFFIPHLGCPHRCVFCDQEKIAGARPILPSPHEITARIYEYRGSAPGRSVEVAFFGGTFTALPRADQERLLAPLQPLIAGGEVVKVRVSTRPDAVSADDASFLKRMGVRLVELGVQSMDDEVLELSGRGHQASHVEEAFRHLKKAGIAVGAQLMPGRPGDTEARSLASLERVLKLEPACLRIYPALVLEGTELARRYREGGYAPLSLPAAVTVGKQMLRAALKHGVPVLRIGLHPSIELAAPGVVLAGPEHPALGQLLESELYYDAARILAAEIPRGSRVVLSCHPRRISDLIGQRRRNLARLQEEFGIEVAAVQPREGLGRTVVALAWGGGERSVDLLEM